MNITFTFYQQLVLSSIIFFIPLNKRTKGIFTFSLLSLFLLIIDLIPINFYNTTANNTFVFIFGALFFFVTPLIEQVFVFRLSCDISYKDSIYAMLCSYATQHFANCFGNIIIFILNPNQYLNTTISDKWISLYTLIYLFCLITFYFIFAKPLTKKGFYNVKTKHTVIASISLFFGAAIISTWAKNIFSGQKALYYIPFYIYDMMCCFFLMWIHIGQQKEIEYETQINTEHILNQQNKEQYNLTKQNIELINIKCHDLKHQINALRLIKDDDDFEDNLDYLQNAIDIYDCQVKTENPVLDTVLTQKSLICQHNDISWTCLAQGELLDFMDTVDTFVLFGNILDNAIEAVLKITNKEQRVINMTLKQEINSVVLIVENYTDNTISFDNSLPLSTKENNGYHGFGLKSITNICKKYNGYMNIDCTDNIFTIKILFPLTH